MLPCIPYNMPEGINQMKRDKYTKRYELPDSETIIAVDSCLSSASHLSTVPERGKFIVMQRHVIFQVRKPALYAPHPRPSTLGYGINPPSLLAEIIHSGSGISTPGP